MIHRIIYRNGQLAPIEDIRLSPGQSGLLNGWGIFTTIRVVDGIPFAFERHWKRLQRDARRTLCPFPFEEQPVREKLATVLSANRVSEGCARIYAVYNQAGFWRSDEDFPETDLIIYSANLPKYRESARLGLREQGRHAASALAGVKVTSWLINVWNFHEAQQAGLDEVVLLNERGEVAECTAANIFCVCDDRVSTPPLASGCLEGVTRSVLLEIGEPAGAAVEERKLLPQDLYAADEVFISSTNRNLLPVSEINGHKIKSVEGPVTRKLERTFESYLRDYIAARAQAAGR